LKKQGKSYAPEFRWKFQKWRVFWSNKSIYLRNL